MVLSIINHPAIGVPSFMETPIWWLMGNCVPSGSPLRPSDSFVNSSNSSASLLSLPVWKFLASGSTYLGMQPRFILSCVDSLANSPYLTYISRGIKWSFSTYDSWHIPAQQGTSMARIFRSWIMVNLWKFYRANLNGARHHQTSTAFWIMVSASSACRSSAQFGTRNSYIHGRILWLGIHWCRIMNKVQSGWWLNPTLMVNILLIMVNDDG